MVKNELYDLLKIGLTEGEAKVYIALTELGSSTVGPIVKKAKVAYSNVYDILNRLIEKGIVSFITKNKRISLKALSELNGHLDANLTYKRHSQCFVFMNWGNILPKHVFTLVSGFSREKKNKDSKSPEYIPYLQIYLKKWS